MVLAENEDALRRIGWPTIAEDEGVLAGDNAVTISRYTGGGVIASVFGNTPEQMLPYLADAIAAKVGWELLFTVGMGGGQPAAAPDPEPDPGRDPRQGRARQGRAQAAALRAGAHPGAASSSATWASGPIWCRAGPR